MFGQGRKKRKLHFYSHDTEIYSLGVSSKWSGYKVVLAALSEMANLPIATHAVIRDGQGQAHILKAKCSMLKLLFVAIRVA